jgi:hypothetical protein
VMATSSLSTSTRIKISETKGTVYTNPFLSLLCSEQYTPFGCGNIVVCRYLQWNSDKNGFFVFVLASLNVSCYYWLFCHRK